MDSFSTTSKAAILVAIYIVLCLQNKIFVDRVQKHFQSSNCCSNSTKNLVALLRFFFSITYLTYSSGTMSLSTVLKNIKFILSLFLSVFECRIFMFFLFLTYLYPILYKSNSSVSRTFFYLDVYIDIWNNWFMKLTFSTIFSNFKKFSTILNGSIDYSFLVIVLNLILLVQSCNTGMNFNTLLWAYYCFGQTEKSFL